MSILTCDDDSVYAHDSAKFQYYAILLKVVQIMGSDKDTEMKALNIYTYLQNFADSIKMPKMALREKMAFYGIRRKIASGEVAFCNCLESKWINLKLKEDESKSETDNSEG